MGGSLTRAAFITAFANKNAPAITEAELLQIARELGDTDTKRIERGASAYQMLRDYILKVAGIQGAFLVLGSNADGNRAFAKAYIVNMPYFSYGVDSPCRTICTVCSAPPCMKNKSY